MAISEESFSRHSAAIESAYEQSLRVGAGDVPETYEWETYSEPARALHSLAREARKGWGIIADIVRRHRKSKGDIPAHEECLLYAERILSAVELSEDEPKAIRVDVVLERLSRVRTPRRVNAMPVMLQERSDVLKLLRPNWSILLPVREWRALAGEFKHGKGESVSESDWRRMANPKKVPRRKDSTKFNVSLDLRFVNFLSHEQKAKICDLLFDFS